MATAPATTDVVFQVTTASTTAPAKFTVSGLQVDTTANAAGPIAATVGQGGTAAAACGTPPTTTLATGVTIASVISVVRLAGSDRYDTARLLAEKKFPCAGTPTTNRFAILARGDKFPDALAGAYLAAHRTGPSGGAAGSPILLTASDSLSGATATGLRDLGINQIIVLGLQGAVSDNVVTQLKATQATDCTGTPATNAQGNPLMISVQRIGGADRFETARLAAECAGCTAGTLATNGLAGAGVPTAIVASGGNFPDALAAGPVANKGTNAGNGAGALPLLLTNTDALSPQAQQGLSDMGIKQVIIPGGTAAVSAAAATSITSMGINVIRLAGADRTDTAGQVAAFEIAVPSATVAGLGYNTNFVQLARGDDFPDALAGGPYAGVTIAPILLTSDPTALGQFTTAYLHNHNAIHSAGGITKIAIFGGTVAVSSDAQNAAVAALSS
jgi:putative cell wall-binding protein